MKLKAEKVNNKERRVVFSSPGLMHPLVHYIPNIWKALIFGKKGINHISSSDAATHDTKLAVQVVRIR